MKIKSINLRINVIGSANEYGFSYEFDSGLNIITGHNSSGKSTVLSCIYYCLGMEQLLGGNRNLLLDKSITREFDYNSKTFTIVQSIAELEISHNERIAILKRDIKSQSYENRNKIIITENGHVSSYLLHVTGDHERESGFYHWLTIFLGISLPKTYSENTDQIKNLYLQNIFPCALIEQTKGWSDFFAQMPNFGIKDARQKLVEFLLDLESLEGEFKKDILAQEEKALKFIWKRKYEKIGELASDKGFILKGINSEPANNELKNVSISSLSRISDDKKEWINLDKDIYILKDKLAAIVKDIKNKNNLATPIAIKASQEKLQSEIALLNRQIRTLNNERISEKQKVDQYIESIKIINIEIERLDSSLKLDNFLPGDKKSPLCPLCDHELDIESRLNLSNSKINFMESISFLKSQKNLYESYVKKYQELELGFNDVSNFLANEVSLKKNEIKNLRKDISSFNDNNLRTDIFNEITISQKINDYIKLSSSFKIIKNDLKDIVADLIRIKEEKSSLKSSDDRDNAKISYFNTKFKELLGPDKFNYTSNHIHHITIQNKPPSRLLPVVIIGGDTQTIRLSSSASDFIRAQWAFYLTLLEISKNHPGFLILDEPGQHAMNIESMTALLTYSACSSKQIIMCISKDTKDRSSTANLNKILQHLDSIDKYKLIDIDPNDQKCVKPL
ncbi:ATPase involved in DNA repair [Serratia fonticola]|uniref:ATPase involved in DNA repair n=1 Tax=Serratia fonticola TaxID=47917 RepID=A0A448S5U4_SERFO|nr:ATPase involved in DNA repair [Serratia fonticola]